MDFQGEFGAIKAADSRTTIGVYRYADHGYCVVIWCYDANGEPTLQWVVFRTLSRMPIDEQNCRAQIALMQAQGILEGVEILNQAVTS